MHRFDPSGSEASTYYRRNIGTTETNSESSEELTFVRGILCCPLYVEALRLLDHLRMELHRV
jgi:hypothetical protein